MDELSHAGIYSWDANLNIITRHQSPVGPMKRAEVSISAAVHLNRVRAGMLLLVQRSPRDTESIIAAWQDVLSVYHAHWEE